jgi:hypothetical protein
MNTRKLYAVRIETEEGRKTVGQRLISRNRALRVAKFLKGRGRSVHIAPLMVNVTAGMRV